MPSRKTLVDAIRVQAAAGRVSAKQAHWLADNTDRPYHFWKAVEELTGGIEADTVTASAAKATLDQWPVKAMARFALTWHKHDPSLVSDRLIESLLTASQIVQGNWDALPDTGTYAVPVTLASELDSTIESICKRLNRHRSTQGEGFVAPCPIAFLPAQDATHTIGLGVDDVVGINLSIDPDSIDSRYWNLLKLTLFLISIYLQPMAMSDDILDYCFFIDEDMEHDIDTVYAYLKKHDLDDSDENLERALSESADVYMASCVDDLHHFIMQRDEVRSVRELWAFDGQSRDDLAKQIHCLPEATCDDEHTIYKVAVALRDQLTHDIDERRWSDLFPAGEAPLFDFHTPVFMDNNGFVTEVIQQYYEHMMGGGEEEDSALFSWRDNPDVLQEISNRLTLAGDHLNRIIRLGEEREEYPAGRVD